MTYERRARSRVLERLEEGRSWRGEDKLRDGVTGTPRGASQAVSPSTYWFSSCLHSVPRRPRRALNEQSSSIAPADASASGTLVTCW